MESMDYKQRVIDSSERNRETMKAAYEEGNERLAQESQKIEAAEDNKTSAPKVEVKPENLILQKMRRIKEELARAFGEENTEDEDKNDAGLESR